MLIGGAQGAYEISPNSVAGLVSDYNVLSNVFTDVDTTTEAGNTYNFAQWQSATGQDKHSILVPSSLATLFVNPSATPPNYSEAAGSPSIDKGSSTDAPPTDILGNPRPKGAGYDIGAYEQ